MLELQKECDVKGGRLLTKWLTRGLRSWILGAAAITAMGAGIIGTQFRPVDIVVQSPKGQRNISLWTFRSKVRDILQQAGIPITAHDRVSPALNQMVAGRAIVVDQAVPIWIKTAHRRLKWFATSYRVEQILHAAGIKLGAMDEVKPALSAWVKPGATIQVIRRWLLTKQVAVTIPYTVEYRPDPNLFKGHTEILSTGRNGTEVKTVQVLMQNGFPVRQTIVKTQQTQAPTPEVILYGTQQLVDRGGQVLQFSRELTVMATAYWPDPAWSSGYTATGWRAQYGIIAVDPAVIPLGSRVYIPGYGIAVAQDTGSAIVGDHIDLCFDTATQAQDWGVRTVNVFILDP